MPRKPRLFVAGGLYHVVLRGNGRADIFFEDGDRERWQSLIHKGLDRYGHRLHAYCWMTNHVHMLLQAGDLPLAGFIGALASTYARSINKRNNRVGHLFERRYRASLVQQDAYLLEVVRYIHLNPVRAHMVDSPDGYPWSSHHAYLGRPRPPWLTTDFVLSCFAPSFDRARTAYRRFFASDEIQLPNSVSEQLSRLSPSDDQWIGNDNWKARTGDQTSTRCLDELVEDICSRFNVTKTQLQSRSRSRLHSTIRAEIALAAVDEGVATITDVARLFGRAHSGLSRAVNRLRDQRQ